MPTTDRQQELTRSLHRSHGSFELAVAPVLMALIGLWLDRTLNTVPVFTIALAVLGVVGSTIKVIYVYKAQMAEQTADSPWRRDVAEVAGK
ncbi:MAG: AtpZ/AtpI family protein [Actinomycetes bacterium]